MRRCAMPLYEATISQPRQIEARHVMRCVITFVADSLERANDMACEWAIYHSMSNYNVTDVHEILPYPTAHITVVSDGMP